MQDQYYNDRQQGNMGYPGLVPAQSGQTYPAMGMEQSKMADPSFGGGGAAGYGGRSTGPDLGPMMRALTEDDLYNQQSQQTQYRQQMAGMAAGYGQNMNYPTQESVPGYGGHTGGGQYPSPFSPGHSPRNTQFFPMHGQSGPAASSQHDGYTSPPVQSPHFGPNGPIGQYQRQSPLMNMASPNGQSSPNVPPFSRAPVTAPSPVMGMQGNNGMYNQSHGNSGHLSHNSPLPSPSNLRSPASVHSPKSLPATSPNTFASPSPSPVGTMAGQTHRQTRSPGTGGPFQQNPAPQPYPIPSPKVRAVEQVSTVSGGNTPYVELVSTRDSPHGSVTSNNSQESVGSKAPYPQKEQSSNRGHLPQLEEMVKFLGEPTAKGILPLSDNDSPQLKEIEDNVNGRNSIDEKVNNSVETDSINRVTDNSESKSVSPADTPALGTSNGPTESPVTGDSEENMSMQNKDLTDSQNVVNNTQNGPDHPDQKSPRRRNNSKSPKRKNSTGQDSPRENHVGGNSPRQSGSPRQGVEDTTQEVKRRRSSPGERGRRRRASGSNVNQRSPRRRNSEGSSDSLPTSPQNRLSKSPRRHSFENPNIKEETEPINNSEGDNLALEQTKTENSGENNPANGAKSDGSDNVKTEDRRTVGENTGGDSQSHSVHVKEENVPENNPLDESESGNNPEVESEIDNTSPMDIPSTSRPVTPRSVTPTFKNPMTTPTLKRNTPESGGSTDSKGKRKGRPVGSKNRTKEEIERDKLLKKAGKRPYRKRSIDPELKTEMKKFKHVAKGGKVADSKIGLQKGPILRIQGTQDNVISSKILNCPQDEHSSLNVVGKKQRKKPGRVAKRYSSMTRVPQGPATMHASEFRPVGEWVCALCGKTSNVGTLGHLYGPYYPHGYQIPPQPPKTDSTSEAKDVEEVQEVEIIPPARKGRGQGTKARLKSKSPLPPPRGKGRGSRGAKTPTSQSGTQRTPRGGGKGASTGKRQPKAAKMEDFDYEYDQTPTVTKGGRRRRRSSSTPGPSSKGPVAKAEQQESASKRRKSLKDDPSRPDPNEIWVHEDCAIWAQGVYAMGSSLYGLYEAVLVAKKVVSTMMKD